VSSITDNGTGTYTVNFATAMPDNNYAYFGTCMDVKRGGGVDVDVVCPVGNGINSGSLEIFTKNTFSGNPFGTFDPDEVYVGIFR